jgi:hypothetical protein
VRLKKIAGGYRRIGFDISSKYLKRELQRVKELNDVEKPFLVSACYGTWL